MKKVATIATSFNIAKKWKSINMKLFTSEITSEINNENSD